MSTVKRKTKREPWDPAQFTYRTVREHADELRAMAKREGMTINALMAEAIYKHVFHLEQRRDPGLRRKSVCFGCGVRMDAVKKRRA